MSTIRECLALVSVLMMATSVAASTGTIETSHTFEARPDATVIVEASSHEVIVTSRPGTTVEVKVWIEVSGRESKMKNVLNDLTPVFEDRGSTLVVRSKRDGNGWTGWGSVRVDGRIEVEMPADMDVRIDVGSGQVSMSGDFGDAALEADTGSGSVRLEGAAGAFVADTGSGSVEAIVTRPLVRFAADTGSGGVRLEGGAGRASVDTGSGSIRLAGLTGDAELDAGSGRVVAAWDAVRPGMRVIADTGSGGVELTFPSGTAFDGSVETGSGGILSDFEGERTGDDDMRFDGGPDVVQLHIDTGSGGVVLRTR